MQLSLLNQLESKDYSNQKIGIGLSGGINSAAVLCHLVKYSSELPKELHLMYSHFEEHSSDTLAFVFDCVRYAAKSFNVPPFDLADFENPFTGTKTSQSGNIFFHMTWNSVLRFFEDENMIPHPSVSPCTIRLKIFWISEMMQKNNIESDLVGYVRNEKRRIDRQIKKGVKSKAYPISHFDDNDCFSLVKSAIGWFPEIYNLKWSDERIGEALKEKGHLLNDQQRGIIEKYHHQGFNHKGNRRVFKHNNCLPCKNMHEWELWVTSVFFPKYADKASETAKKINSHWGREDQKFCGNVLESASCTYCEFD